MATVLRHTISTYLPATWVSWFNNLNCSLIEASSTSNGFTINVDDNLTINATCYDSGWLNPLTITYQESTTGEIARLKSSSGIVVTVCYSDTLFYVQMSDATYRRFMFCYEKLTGGDYFYYRGGGNNESQGYYGMTNWGGIKVGEAISATSNIHRPLLNYTSDLGYVDIIDHDVICVGNNTPYTKVESDTNFVHSSTISPDYVYAITGANYYAIGTNLLVLMEN